MADNKQEGLFDEDRRKTAPVEEPADEWEMDWLKGEEIIVEGQQSIACYRNARGHILIRQERRSGDDEDSVIALANADSVRALIAALQRELKEGFR